MFAAELSQRRVSNNVHDGSTSLEACKGSEPFFDPDMHDAHLPASVGVFVDGQRVFTRTRFVSFDEPDSEVSSITASMRQLLKEQNQKQQQQQQLNANGGDFKKGFHDSEGRPDSSIETSAKHDINCDIEDTEPTEEKMAALERKIAEMNAKKKAADNKKAAENVVMEDTANFEDAFSAITQEKEQSSF